MRSSAVREHHLDRHLVSIPDRYRRWIDEPVADHAERNFALSGCSTSAARAPGALDGPALLSQSLPLGDPAKPLQPSRHQRIVQLMPPIIFSMHRMNRTFPPGKQVLKDISLSFFEGAKIGIVGLNGSGKSSLLKIIAGLDKEFSGDLSLRPNLTIGYLEQEPKLNPNKTVKENVMEGCGEAASLLADFEAVSAKLGEDISPEEMEKLIDRQAALQDKIDALGAWELDRTLEIAMDALRCPPPEADVKVLSGGERRRVALCKLLLQKPDLLLLDEPTNHLDAESVLWLEQHLSKYEGTVVAITHDRYFLDNVAQWILELDRGRAYPYEGNYTTYLETKEARMKVEGQKDAKRAKRLKEELEWVRMNAKGRQVKSKARLARYEEMAAEADKTRKLDF